MKKQQTETDKAANDTTKKAEPMALVLLETDAAQAVRNADLQSEKAYFLQVKAAEAVLASNKSDGGKLAAERNRLELEIKRADEKAAAALEEKDDALFETIIAQREELKLKLDALDVGQKRAGLKAAEAELEKVLSERRRFRAQLLRAAISARFEGLEKKAAALVVETTATLEFRRRLEVAGAAESTRDSQQLATDALHLGFGHELSWLAGQRAFRERKSKLGFMLERGGVPSETRLREALKDFMPPRSPVVEGGNVPTG